MNEDKHLGTEGTHVDFYSDKKNHICCNNPNLFNNRGKIQQLKLFDHI